LTAACRRSIGSGQSPERDGGNVFALQRILGHESLEMVKRYLSLAQMDLEKAHQDASPVANWLL